MVQIVEDKRCSKCKAFNLYDENWKGDKLICRCRVCGHESIRARITTTATATTKTLVFPPLAQTDIEF